MRDKICRNEENAAATFSESTRMELYSAGPSRRGMGRDKRYQ